MNKKKKLLLSLLAVGLTAANISAQVGIGTRQPDEAAMLDIVSTDKGVLIPRVLLDSEKCDLDKKQGQPAGLLVYNTGNNILSEGFYFWNGKEWKIIESTTSVTPSISKLECSRANLEPQSFSAKKPFIGQLTIPYSGGNGGKYSSVDIIKSKGNEGLQIRLKPGRLEHGSGYLVYDVTGTPKQNSPVGATFDIEFKGHKCSVTVGEVQSANITSIASVGPLEKTSEDGWVGYHRVVTSPDGKFSVRVFVKAKNGSISGTTLSNADLQIRSNKRSETIMWNGHVSYRGGTKGTGSNKFTLPMGNVWYGNKPENGDNWDTGVEAAWGDRDVYYDAPEQRRYIWTSVNTSDNTVYILTFMMGAPSPYEIADDATARKTKAFLRIEQVHAD